MILSPNQLTDLVEADRKLRLREQALDAREARIRRKEKQHDPNMAYMRYTFGPHYMKQLQAEANSVAQTHGDTPTLQAERRRQIG